MTVRALDVSIRITKRDEMLRVCPVELRLMRRRMRSHYCNECCQNVVPHGDLGSLAVIDCKVHVWVDMTESRILIPLL